MSMGRRTLSGLDSRTDRLQGWRVTVMGLGRHGGGVASAAFFASRGARVTVTDLRTSVELSGSMQKLEPYHIRYVLGEHRNHDFVDADLIIKNPAVPSHSPYLALGRRRGIPIETDVSIFLRCSTNPVLAVTGTKGKSTVASAIHHGLARDFPQARLGGNITVSPLIFLSGVRAYPDALVVLEFSF